jgi:rhamnulokinase
LEAADSILFMPDALSYMLTGKKICEYTIASTSQILNPRTKQFENKLLEAAGIKPGLLQPIVMPGEVIGTLTDEIAEVTGAGKVPVVAVAGHDTGSAVAAVPADNERFAYLSSGTWSLMGIEVKDPIIDEDAYNMNFTNEGGIAGTTRFLKNITGMWLLEQFRRVREKEGKKYTYPEIIQMAESAENFRSFIDPDHPYFAGAGNMPESIRKYCVETGQQEPRSDAEFIRLIFESLALKYKYVLNKLEKIAPFTIEKLHVIGGGSQNKLMNQLTADSIGIPVIAGPTEATAAGNVMMQAYATGLVKDLSEMRQVIKKSVTPEVYLPKNTSLWEDAYKRFVELVEK